MRITFVMGMACAGKSTYIKEHFPNTTVIDLYDFQKNKKFLGYDEIATSYEECKDAVLKAIKRGEDVVMEHTLLKAIRRKPYIDAIREITDAPIDIVLINPELHTLAARSQRRGSFSSESYLKSNLEILEIPTKEEGFENITIVEDKEEGFEDIFEIQYEFNNLEENYLYYIFMDNASLTFNCEILDEQIEDVKNTIKKLLEDNNFKYEEKENRLLGDLSVLIEKTKIELTLNKQPNVNLLEVKEYVENFIPIVKELFLILLSKKIKVETGFFSVNNSINFKNKKELLEKTSIKLEDLPANLDEYVKEHRVELTSFAIHKKRTLKNIVLFDKKFIKLEFNLLMNLFFNKTPDKIRPINNIEYEMANFFEMTFKPFSHKEVAKFKGNNLFI